MSKRKSTGSRAVGVGRVSRVGDRETATLTDQAKRIEDACAREGFALAAMLEESDVSGGAPLTKRPGLLRAVETIEAGDADVLIVAYFDRLVRSLNVQAEVVERVEAAGGRILALDTGELTNGSAGQWLSGTMLGMVAEYHRRATAERLIDPKRRAVERGVPPFPWITAAYQRREDGTLEPSPLAPAVTEAFERRARGESIAALRRYLREQGLEITSAGLYKLFASRLVRGEIHFGGFSNLHAHAPIVDERTWRKVQQAKAPAGRRAKSDRLLARLGVLRCGSCGAAMAVRTTRGRWYSYTCAGSQPCAAKASVAAHVVEDAVRDVVIRESAAIVGRASADAELAAATLERERAELELDGALRTLAGFEEPAARERLLELREVRDRALAHEDQLRALVTPDRTVTTGQDWDTLTPAGRRALVRAIVARVTVAPGRGPDRLTVELRKVAP